MKTLPTFELAILLIGSLVLGAGLSRAAGFLPSPVTSNTVLAPTAVPVAGAKAVLSPLGDLTAYRLIAEDALTMAKSGKLKEAKARIKDLETAWDQAEGDLKPKDKKTWTVVDQAIDLALAQLRKPTPDQAKCVAALTAFIDQCNALAK